MVDVSVSDALLSRIVDLVGEVSQGVTERLDRSGTPTDPPEVAAHREIHLFNAKVDTAMKIADLLRDFGGEVADSFGQAIGDIRDKVVLEGWFGKAAGIALEPVSTGLQIALTPTELAGPELDETGGWGEGSQLNSLCKELDQELPDRGETEPEQEAGLDR